MFMSYQTDHTEWEQPERENYNILTSTLLHRRALFKSSTVSFLLLACLINWELLCAGQNNTQSIQLVCINNLHRTSTYSDTWIFHTSGTDLRCLPEPVAHVFGQQCGHIVAELHACTLGHQSDRLPGNLGKAALLPVRHAHDDHSLAGKSALH